MYAIDLFMRYGGACLLLVIAILSFRDARAHRIWIYICLAAGTIAFMLLGTGPEELHLPSPVHEIIRILDVGNIVFIWWLGLAIFDDNFKLRWFHWVVLIVNAGSLLPVRYLELQGKVYFPPLLNYTLDLISLGIMLHLVYVALSGRSDDLIEPRRRFRIIFVLAMVVATLTALFGENLLFEENPALLSLIKGLTIFPLALCAVLWLTRFHPENIVFEDSPTPISVAPTIDPRDQLLLKNLKALMDTDNIYTEPGLTIRTLAEKLATPEHRLRVLINQGLGFRNFSSYLNSYRIGAVKTAMSTPQNSRTPILTLAMDAGYNSLAPFNRAFKDIEGVTPSTFRQKILSNSDQN